jgi:hypothetical protein
MSSRGWRLQSKQPERVISTLGHVTGTSPHVGAHVANPTAAAHKPHRCSRRRRSVSGRVMKAEPQRLTNTGSDKAAGGPRDARDPRNRSRLCACGLSTAFCVRRRWSMPDNRVITRFTTASIAGHRNRAEIQKIAHRMPRAGGILERGWSMFDQQPMKGRKLSHSSRRHRKLGKRHARLGGHS